MLTTTELRHLIAPLIDPCSEAIVLTDLQGYLVFANGAAERLIGQAISATVGARAAHWLPAGVPASVMRDLLRCHRRGQTPTVRRELAVLNAQPQQPLLLLAGLILVAQQPIATFGILRPPTDGLRSSLVADRRIEERAALLSELAGTAAHELNQPLTSIISAAELLKRALGEGSMEHRTTELIVRECERMAQVVRNLANVTHYETKSYVGHQRILDLDKASAHTASASSVSRSTLPPKP